MSHDNSAQRTLSPRKVTARHCHVVAVEVLFAFILTLKYEDCIYFISTHTVAALILSNCLGDPIGFIL